MKEIDAAQMRANLKTLTVETCRRNAVESSINAERLFDEGNDAGALFAQQQATMWATLALSCAPPEITVQPSIGLQLPGDPPDREHECCHNSQRLPGARLLAAGDPEPQVNPGALFVDPSGVGARFLLRIDGVDDREWLWCDSLAQAEETLDEAGTWATAMGCGILRVREAAEREQVEFREGTGGAALDLVRRLLATLARNARDHGQTAVAQWLATCDEKAPAVWSTEEWPAAPEPENPNVHAEYGAEAALRRAAEMAPEAPNGPAWRDWLLACARVGIGPGKNPWPAPPSRDVIVEILAKRLRDTASPADAPPGPADDERWRAGTGGGAAQWREG